MCPRLCWPWRVHECVNCAMFTHATNAEQPDDDKVLVNARLLVCIISDIYRHTDVMIDRSMNTDFVTVIFMLSNIK